MINHSPTPWTIEPSDELENREIWDAKLQCVCQIYGPPEAGHSGPEQDILEADARLIQAAPAMYAFLREIINYPDEIGYEKITNLLNDIEEAR